MHADPEARRFVGEDVDVVIPAADGAELISRFRGERRALGLRRNRAPHRRFEQRVFGRRVVGAIASSDTEADGRLNLVGDIRETGEVLVGHVHRRVDGVER